MFLRVHCQFHCRFHGPWNCQVEPACQHAFIQRKFLLPAGTLARWHAGRHACDLALCCQRPSVYARKSFAFAWVPVRCFGKLCQLGTCCHHLVACSLPEVPPGTSQPCSTWLARRVEQPGQGRGAGWMVEQRQARIVEQTGQARGTAWQATWNRLATRGTRLPGAWNSLGSRVEQPGWWNGTSP